MDVIERLIKVSQIDRLYRCLFGVSVGITPAGEYSDEAIQREWLSLRKMFQLVNREHGVTLADFDRDYSTIGLPRHMAERIQQR